MALSLVTHAEPVNRDLRRELQDAICDRNAAEARARSARDIFNKADIARREASEHVARLRADMDATSRAEIARVAKRFEEALRAGSDLPATAMVPPIETPALTTATARADALELASRALAQEADKAADAAARAANTVASLVASILEADARALAAEEKAAFEHYWRIRDRLAGYARMETKLTDISDDIAKGLNRQKRLALKDPLFLESGYWMSFLDRVATGTELEWRDYGR